MFNHLRGQALKLDQEDAEYFNKTASNLVCEIRSSKEKISDNGKLYLNCCFKILEGKYVDQVFFGRFYKTEKSERRLNWFLAKCKAAIKDINGVYQLPPDFDFKKDLIGKKIVVDTEAGEHRPDIKSFKSVEEVNFENANKAVDINNLPELQESELPDL